MKKTVYYLGLILLVFLPEILSAQLPKGIRVPTGSTPAEMPQVTDANCNYTYPITIGVYNLDLINGLDYSDWQTNSNEGNPPPLSLPDSYPPMNLVYNIGGTTGTVSVDEFNFRPIIEDPLYVFTFTYNVTVNLSSQCSGFLGPSQEIDLPIFYSIDKEDGSPYPVCSFMSPGDLFDCTYYDSDACPSGRVVRCNRSKQYQLTTASYNERVECSAECRDDLPTGAVVRSQEASNNLSKGKLATEVMPNPFDTYLNIKWHKETINPIIRLYDASGRMIKSWTNKSYNENEVFQEDMTDLSKGIYFLHIQNGKESIYTKVVKS